MHMCISCSCANVHCEALCARACACFGISRNKERKQKLPESLSACYSSLRPRPMTRLGRIPSLHLQMRKNTSENLFEVVGTSFEATLPRGRYHTTLASSSTATYPSRPQPVLSLSASAPTLPTYESAYTPQLALPFYPRGRSDYDTQRRSHFETQLSSDREHASAMRLQAQGGRLWRASPIVTREIRLSGPNWY